MTSWLFWVTFGALFFFLERTFSVGLSAMAGASGEGDGRTGAGPERVVAEPVRGARRRGRARLDRAA